MKKKKTNEQFVLATNIAVQQLIPQNFGNRVIYGFH